MLYFPLKLRTLRGQEDDLKIRLLILLLLSLTLTACGAENLPGEEADPPQMVQPEEPPEAVSPDETEDPAPAREIPPLEGTPLTEEELAQVNEAFNAYGNADGGRALEYACFFTSSYEDVTELNFEEFLRYYFNESSEVLDGDAEEFRALAALPGFPFSGESLEAWENRPGGLPVPVHRIPRAAVDETLKTCAGITTADLKNTDGTLYLPKYDSYYNFTSDYGPGWFEAAEGARDGDTVRLRSEALRHEEGEAVRELALREEDGRWLIQSFAVLPTGNG